MKVTFLSLFLFLGTMFSNVQSQNISGNVIDANTSTPLLGVSVSVKGTNIGTVTDFDGNFSIPNVNPDSKLTFSYLGYKTLTLSVGIENNFSVKMLEDLSELDEIVVIGYGSQKLSDISGAVSTVNSKAIEAIKPVRIEDALQGQASGINIISSGSPGSKPTVLIRGITSYAGNSPLVVIDGVSQSIDDLNSLNPSDIKSVNVLKDAALASIYGVKGGSGVIVVTTKSGERNTDTSFNFSTSVGNQSVVKMIDVLNASEYAGILNEASMAAGEGLIYPNLSEIGKGTNWQNEVINDAAIVNHSITASGGSDKTSFYVSAGYLGQDGVVGPSDKSYFNRTNFTTNINTDLTEKTKLIINTNYTNIKGKGLPENGINSVLSNSLNFDPTVNPYENGSFGTSETITQEIINPLAQMDNTYNEGNTNKLTGKIELQHNLLDNLKITSRFGYTFVDIYNKNFIPLVYYGAGHNATNANEDLSPIVSVDAEGTIVSTHNRISESKTNYFNYTFETYANYDFTIQEDHNFQTVLGFSIGENKGENISAYNEDVPFNSWAYADISAATGNSTQQTSGSWQYVGRNVSYFSRLLYDFQEKYYFSFTGRVDGSTSFGANNKFGFFPSASFGWVVSKEDFIGANAPFDYLKFRASYGSLGNDNINPQFALISTFPSYTFDGSIINGSALGSVPNEDVSWENQVQMNFGIDTRLLDNKLSITVDYFKKTVDDLLFSPNLSLYLGTPSFPTTNIGKTQSTGIDASISYNTTIGKEFNISSNVNFTTSDNEVLAINNGDKYIWGAGYGIPYTPIVRFEEGYSPGYFFGYKTDGIFQTQSEVNSHATQNGAAPGDIRFTDVNGDGVINDEDRTEIGDPFADFTIGWNLAIDYKNFDFSVFTYASVGNDIYRAYERNLNYTNRFASTLDRWTGAGTSNTEPRVSFVDSNNNRRASDRYIEDGSYLRIKNIQLGYTFSQSFADKIGFDEIRAYTQLKNALTITEYSGYDPEISNGGVLNTGIDIGTYPQPRIWSMGLNIKF